MADDLQEQENQDIDKTEDKWAHLRPTQFKPGQSGNPKGRPAGPSLKEWSKTYLMSLTDDEKLEFMAGIDKKTVWEMAEGKPDTNIDHTTAGKELPAPIISLDVQRNDSTTEDSETKQEG